MNRFVTGSWTKKIDHNKFVSNLLLENPEGKNALIYDDSPIENSNLIQHRFSNLIELAYFLESLSQLPKEFLCTYYLYKINFELVHKNTKPVKKTTRLQDQKVIFPLKNSNKLYMAKNAKHTGTEAPGVLCFNSFKIPKNIKFTCSQTNLLEDEKILGLSQNILNLTSKISFEKAHIFAPDYGLCDILRSNLKSEKFLINSTFGVNLAADFIECLLVGEEKAIFIDLSKEGHIGIYYKH